MPGGETRAKRGRPPKFGQRGRVVAVTLPEDVVRGLKRLNADLAWAIVRLFEKRSPRGASPRNRPADSELLHVARDRSLIVVDRRVFKELPGISLIPFDGNRAFLALGRDAGAADLELAVVDRLTAPAIGSRERRALVTLRTQLRRWRRDPAVRCRTRSIILVERAR